MTSPAFWVSGEGRQGPFLVTCDHATNFVPPDVAGGDLGIAPEDMARHIAYDIGAAGVARALGAALDSPVVGAGFSRLVIDPNRGEDDPTLVMRLYDGTIIPANRYVDEGETERRLTRFYRPYHQAIAELAGDRAIISIHSFTPCLRGRAPRPWHIGVLSSPVNDRLARLFIARLSQESDLCVGDNEPYHGHLPGDAIDRHALQMGRHNLLIELRQDLIAYEDQQTAWALRLAPMLAEVRATL